MKLEILIDLVVKQWLARTHQRMLSCVITVQYTLGQTIHRADYIWKRKRKVEGRGRGRKRKRKGKGEREIGSEALAETEKSQTPQPGICLAVSHYAWVCGLVAILWKMPYPLVTTAALDFVWYFSVQFLCCKVLIMLHCKFCGNLNRIANSRPMPSDPFWCRNHGTGKTAYVVHFHSMCDIQQWFCQAQPQ